MAQVDPISPEIQALETPVSPSQQSARPRSVSVPFRTPEGGTNYVDIAPQTAIDLQGSRTPPPSGAPISTNVADYADLIAAPSTRPAEPMTTGAPFGAGSNFVKFNGEPEVQFRQRISEQLLASPAADSSVKQFVSDYLNGF